MERKFDSLMREALRRRAERVPMLPSDMAERVAERMKAPLQLPTRVEGHPSQHVNWLQWKWVGSIAAVLVLGLFVFLDADRTEEMNGTKRKTGNEASTAVQPSVAEGGTSALTLPTPVEAMPDAGHVKQTCIAETMPKAGHEKRASREETMPKSGRVEQTNEETMGAEASYAVLQTMLDEMETEAISEAMLITNEVVGEAYASDCPT